MVGWPVLSPGIWPHPDPGSPCALLTAALLHLHAPCLPGAGWAENLWSPFQKAGWLPRRDPGTGLWGLPRDSELQNRVQAARLSTEGTAEASQAPSPPPRLWPAA